MHTDPASAVRPTLASRSAIALALAGPLLLLGIEAIVLTPQVEFQSGHMVQLASPALFSISFLSLTFFLILGSGELRQVIRPISIAHQLTWLLVNAVAFGLLYHFTLDLDRQIEKLVEPVKWWQVMGWLSLVIAVGLSAWLAFLSEASISEWLWQCWDKAFASVVIAIVFVATIPWIQSLWFVLQGPTMVISRYLLVLEGHDPANLVLEVSENGNPTLGVGIGSSLEITRYCAEMESLVLFLVLCALLCLVNWRNVTWRWILPIALFGLAALFLINALRLAVLVQIAGAWGKPFLAVDLAHSRIGSLAFLALSVLLLLSTKRWWYVREAGENEGARQEAHL